MDQLRAMRLFVTVAEAGSLSAAARLSGLPLATVSRNLALLENRLDTSLITRSTRRMALTDAGRDFLETSRRVIEELDGAASRIAGGGAAARGEIAITAPVMFGQLHVVPLFAKFLAANPGLTGRLMLTDRIIDLAEEGIDVAFRIGELPDSTLIATKIGSVRILTCAAPSYLRRCGEPKSVAGLADHDTIHNSNLAVGGPWTFSSRLHGRHTVRTKARLSVNTIEAGIASATTGLGITRLFSYQAVAALKARRLQTVLDAFEDREIPVSLVRRPVRSIKPVVRLFLDFAVEGLRRRISELAYD